MRVQGCVPRHTARRQPLWAPPPRRGPLTMACSPCSEASECTGCPRVAPSGELHTKPGARPSGGVERCSPQPPSSRRSSARSSDRYFSNLVMIRRREGQCADACVFSCACEGGA
jgi:hypothetical protein